MQTGKGESERKALCAIRAAEQAFLDYFMTKVAPSQESETKRQLVFAKLKSLIENALGNTILTILQAALGRHWCYATAQTR